jgi:hypothetical protein
MLQSVSLPGLQLGRTVFQQDQALPACGNVLRQARANYLAFVQLASVQAGAADDDDLHGLPSDKYFRGIGSEKVHWKMQ